MCLRPSSGGFLLFLWLVKEEGRNRQLWPKQKASACLALFGCSGLTAARDQFPIEVLPRALPADSFR